VVTLAIFGVADILRTRNTIFLNFFPPVKAR